MTFKDTRFGLLAALLFAVPGIVFGAIATVPEDAWPSVSVRLSDPAADAAEERSAVRLDKVAAFFPREVNRFPEAAIPLVAEEPQQPADSGEVEAKSATAAPSPPEIADAPAAPLRSQPATDETPSRVVTPLSAVVAFFAIAILCILVSRYMGDKHRLQAEVKRQMTPGPIRDIRPYRSRTKSAVTGAPKVYRLPKAEPPR